MSTKKSEKKADKSKKRAAAKRDNEKAQGSKAGAGKKTEKKVTKVDLTKFPKPTNRYMKSLAVTLSPKEKDDRQKEAARVYDEIDQAKLQKKIATENVNATIKEKEARLKILMGIAKTGKEDREVKVCVVADTKQNQMLTVVESTGDVVESRTMTAEERVAQEPKKPGTVTKLAVVKDTDDGKKGTHTQPAEKEKAAHDAKPALVDGKTASTGERDDEDDGDTDDDTDGGAF